MNNILVPIEDRKGVLHSFDFGDNKDYAMEALKEFLDIVIYQYLREDANHKIEDFLAPLNRMLKFDYSKMENEDYMSTAYIRDCIRYYKICDEQELPDMRKLLDSLVNKHTLSEEQKTLLNKINS